MTLNQAAPRNKIPYITIHTIVFKRIGERQWPSFFIDLPSPATSPLNTFQSKSPGLFARPHSPGMSPDEFSAPILNFIKLALAHKTKASHTARMSNAKGMPH